VDKIFVRRIKRMVDFEVLRACGDDTGDNNVAAEECRGIAARKDLDPKATKGSRATCKDRTGSVSFLKTAGAANANDAITGGRGEVVAGAAGSACVTPVRESGKRFTLVF
jgi:hypothetical protein